MLAVMTTMTMTAGDVTPEEALQKATNFVRTRMQKADGQQMAPAQAPQLALAGKVSGLYVFNVQNEGGYVIVSPSDQTEAILGFSESGHLDLNNIPDNMRAWLEGYAEEINSLQSAGTTEAVEAPPAAAGKSNIAPIVSAHWDQFGAYNLTTPTKGGEHTLTGCMAVAMSQAMNVFKHPSSVAKDIPGYTTRTEHLTVNTVPAGTTINWSNIQDAYGWYNYDGSGWVEATYTNTQATAVSNLMLYCGASLGMDYGLSYSGANTVDVASGLTKYFDYEKNTTMFLVRSGYSDANWIDILYHELSKGRPIVYSGSGNGGHGFICDGYKTGDYFHFNWGWSTMGSDGYYLLNGLNPTNTSYNFNNNNQAVIGIQPTGYGGSVSPKVFQTEDETIRLIDVVATPDPVHPNDQLTITATVQNLTKTTLNSYVIFVEQPRTSFNYNDCVEFTLASGAIAEVSKTVTAPSSEGELIYQIIGASGGYWTLLGLSDPITVSNSATGINNTLNEEREMKNEIWYDLSGRRVENPTNGIFIINGKKVKK